MSKKTKRLRTWAWRETYRVHPAADVFPMMSDEKLAALGANIKANGLIEPITVDGDRTLLDGRNRLAAMELAGVELIGGWWHEDVYQGDDPVGFIISKNIHRRHLNLTKQEQLDLIVDVRMAANKPGHRDPVSRGGRGKVNPVKAAVIADAKAAGLDPSESTVKRAMAKAEGKVPAKPNRRSKAEISQVRAQSAGAEGKTPATMPKYAARPMPKPKSGKPVVGIDAVRQCYLDRCAEPDVDLDAEQETVIDALLEIAALSAGNSKGRASALLEDGRSEDGPL
jgi:hypothetical protein